MKTREYSLFILFKNSSQVEVQVAINTSTLRNYSRQSIYGRERFGSLHEAKAAAAKTAFLCHSHSDQDLIRGLLVYFKNSGWDIYVDWMDNSMPTTPNKATAEKIQAKIRSTDYFLYLATRNSSISTWCPWEIGYADGIQKGERILIIPTEENGAIYGNEYLQLYRCIDIARDGNLAAWKVNDQNGVYVKYL